MFLIYNFHLHEKINFQKIPQYKSKIKNILGRCLTPGDLYNIQVYGLESFYFSCLKGVNEKHLMEGWKKMNKIWALYNVNKRKNYFSEEDKRYIDILDFSIKNNLFYKIATSIDHLIKIYNSKFYVCNRFFEIMKEIFPIMFYKDL